MDGLVWWQRESARTDLLVALDHFNGARALAGSRPGWEVDACGDMFKGLNKLWAIRDQELGPYPSDTGRPATDLKRFKELAKGLGPEVGSQVLNGSAARALAAFDPVILNHAEPGMNQAPLNELPDDLKERAGRAHRSFRESLVRWEAGRGEAARPLGDLAFVLSIVRNNLMHGEKTRTGPDRARTRRNRDVARVVLAVVWEIADAVLDRPSRKLASYGTLGPNRANNTLVPVDGTWAPVTLRGQLGELNELPAFIPDPSGDDVSASVLLAQGLPNAWEDLDRSEETQYERTLVWFNGEPPGVGYAYVPAERY